VWDVLVPRLRRASLATWKHVKHNGTWEHGALVARVAAAVFKLEPRAVPRRVWAVLELNRSPLKAVTLKTVQVCGRRELGVPAARAVAAVHKAEA
jgi:hypothetical protein